MKNVIILGSTGSIGTQTLEVIEKLEGYKVSALSCGKNIELLKKQIEKFSPKFVCTQTSDDADVLSKIYPQTRNIGTFCIRCQISQTRRRHGH